MKVSIGQHKIKNPALIKSSFPVKKQSIRQQQSNTILKIYKQYQESKNNKQQRKFLWDVMDLCYNNLNAQKKLVESINLPFIAGPVSLNQLPASLLKHNQTMKTNSTIKVSNLEQEQQISQLQFLFNFLKNVKQYYFCWVIYFNEDLYVLNIKLFKKQQINEHKHLFDPSHNLIGIFVNRCKATSLACAQQTFIVREHCDQSEFYGSSQLSKIHAKSTASPNNTTGSSFQFGFQDSVKQQICDENKQGNFKKNRMKFRSISPKNKIEFINKYQKGLSLGKQKQEPMDSLKIEKTINTQQNQKHELKFKSKSNIQLFRSKSSKFRQQAIERSEKILHHLIINKEGKGGKTKLRKQNKIRKIQSIYTKQCLKHNI